jgi:hypothetical protein
MWASFFVPGQAIGLVKWRYTTYGTRLSHKRPFPRHAGAMLGRCRRPPRAGRLTTRLVINVA